jgi:hypothetical protein
VGVDVCEQLDEREVDSIPPHAAVPDREEIRCGRDGNGDRSDTLAVLFDALAALDDIERCARDVALWAPGLAAHHFALAENRWSGSRRGAWPAPRTESSAITHNDHGSGERKSSTASGNSGPLTRSPATRQRQSRVERGLRLEAPVHETGGACVATGAEQVPLEGGDPHLPPVLAACRG